MGHRRVCEIAWLSCDRGGHEEVRLRGDDRFCRDETALRRLSGSLRHPQPRLLQRVAHDALRFDKSPLVHDQERQPLGQRTQVAQARDGRFQVAGERLAPGEAVERAPRLAQACRSLFQRGPILEAKDADAASLERLREVGPVVAAGQKRFRRIAQQRLGGGSRAGGLARPVGQKGQVRVAGERPERTDARGFDEGEKQLIGAQVHRGDAGSRSRRRAHAREQPQSHEPKDQPCALTMDDQCAMWTRQSSHAPDQSRRRSTGQPGQGIFMERGRGSHKSELMAGYTRAARRRSAQTIGLALLVLACAAISIMTGPVDVPLDRILPALFGADAEYAVIVQEVRAPRAILSVLVGGALGLCGAAAQALTRNPLAEPAVFGTPQAAALGAVLALHTGAAHALSFALPAAAFVGAWASILLLMAVLARTPSIVSALLAGVALGAICAAAISLVLTLSPNPFATSEIVFWLMGSFTDRSARHVFLALPPIVAGCLLIVLCARDYRLLALGEAAAAAAGVRVRWTMALTTAGMGLAVAGATAAAGAIGFVGLLAAHLVRSAYDADPKAILAPAFLMGAALTTLADIAAKSLPAAQEPPVGALTAVVGSAAFLVLVLGGRWSFRDFPR